MALIVETDSVRTVKGFFTKLWAKKHVDRCFCAFVLCFVIVDHKVFFGTQLLNWIVRKALIRKRNAFEFWGYIGTEIRYILSMRATYIRSLHFWITHNQLLYKVSTALHQSILDWKYFLETPKEQFRMIILQFPYKPWTWWVCAQQISWSRKSRRWGKSYSLFYRSSWTETIGKRITYK